MEAEEARAAFRALVRAQDGVFSVAQARAAGYSGDAVRRRLRSREWERLGRGVLRVATHPQTPRSRVFAAMLSLGDGAVLVGPSAAWWRKLWDVAPALVDVAVNHDARPAPRRGVRLHRRDIPEADQVVVDGVRVTDRATTVLDAAADLGLLDGARLVDRALQRGATTLAALREAQARRSGRPGTELVRTLLVLAAGGARSEAERIAHRCLRAGGITGWVADVEVVLPGYGRAVLDVVFADARLVIEIDGWAFHRDQHAFVRDEARQNALTVAGWTVLRTNWFELTRDPAAFLAAVRAVLGRRSRSGV